MAGRLLRRGETVGPTDLYVPLKTIFVPQTRQAVKHDISELTTMAGGRAAKPKEAFGFTGSDGSTNMVVGAGVTEAAEMEDNAYRQEEKLVERAKESKEERRERLGLPAPWTPDEFHEYWENVSKAKKVVEDKLDISPDTGQKRIKEFY